VLQPQLLCLYYAHSLYGQPKRNKNMHVKVYGYFIIVYYVSTKSNPFIFHLYLHFFAYVDRKSKRNQGKKKGLADSNESYDIKDLEDDFKGHDIKVFN
jgi:hypothetical protein